MLFSLSLLVLQFLPLPCLGLLEEAFVSFNSSPGALSITNAPILYGSDDFVGVRIAADSLAGDFEAITGKRPESRNITAEEFSQSGVIGASQSAIIVGSLNSTIVQRLVSNGTVDTSGLQGKWETFKTVVVTRPFPGIPSALVIVGSDKRGAIFGIHALGEQAGQSPYHWYADVPTKKHNAIYALNKTTVHGEPSVKYRGLFINDEAPATTTWWAKYHNTSHYPLNTEFYEHVFDLLLRLKANYLWPAMWAMFTPPPGNIFFTDDPHNQQLADDYGIVVSTSHHEPMQKATNEWNATVSGPWDWTLNKDNVTKFMEDGVRRAGNNETYFTLGIRGPGDSALEGDNAIEILTEVFKVQRGLFKKYYGSETSAHQAWTIYKEVATYYAAGLNPPEDVTLILPDDNFGNVQRLPRKNETSREGGFGVYYHLEYLGAPTPYKWQNTNNLPKVYKELSQAKMRGADRIWVINVGDVKPMELPFNFIMELAWDASKLDFEKIPTYLNLWATREFGSQHAQEIASVLLEHSHLIGMRKYEAVTASIYSAYYYHEVERVLTRWQALANQSSALYDLMSEEYKPAFYQLVYYPIASGATYYAVKLGISRNQQYSLERRNSANEVAKQAQDSFESDYDLTHEFDTLLGGKWNSIMSQAKYDDNTALEPYGNSRDWVQPARDLLMNLSYVSLRQNMEFTLGNLGIYAEESLSASIQGRWAESLDASDPTTQYTPTLPEMSPYGPSVRTVDLFMRGDYRIPVNWTLQAPSEPWLSITPTAGTLSQSKYDQRLNITIDWSQVPENYNKTVTIPITAQSPGYPYSDIIRVPVQNHKIPSNINFTGFPETNGIISIEGPHYQRTSNSTAVAFTKIPYLGTRSESGSLALRPYTAARNNASTTASAEYDIYLFNRSTSVNATVYINACLDTDPDLLLKFSLTLADAPANFTRVLGDPKTVGDVPPEWTAGVLDSVWKKTVSLGSAAEGKHTLVWRANSPEVYLEKIVVDMGRGGLKSSYLGPPETVLVE